MTVLQPKPEPSIETIESLTESIEEVCLRNWEKSMVQTRIAVLAWSLQQVLEWQKIFVQQKYDIAHAVMGLMPYFDEEELPDEIISAIETVVAGCKNGEIETYDAKEMIEELRKEESA